MTFHECLINLENLSISLNKTGDLSPMEISLLKSLYNEKYGDHFILDDIEYKSLDREILVYLEDFPKTVKEISFPFCSWSNPCPEEESRREVNVKNPNYEAILTEFIDKRMSANEIVQIPLDKVSNLLAYWKYDVKFFKLSFEELIDHKEFKSLYISYLNGKEIPMPYIEIKDNRYYSSFSS